MTCRCPPAERNMRSSTQVENYLTNNMSFTDDTLSANIYSEARDDGYGHTVVLCRRLDDIKPDSEMKEAVINHLIRKSKLKSTRTSIESTPPKKTDLYVAYSENRLPQNGAESPSLGSSGLFSASSIFWSPPFRRRPPGARDRGFAGIATVLALMSN